MFFFLFYVLLSSIYKQLCLQPPPVPHTTTLSTTATSTTQHNTTQKPSSKWPPQSSRRVKQPLKWWKQERQQDGLEKQCTSSPGKFSLFHFLLYQQQFNYNPVATTISYLVYTLLYQHHHTLESRQCICSQWNSFHYIFVEIQLQEKIYTLLCCVTCVIGVTPRECE